MKKTILFFALLLYLTVPSSVQANAGPVLYPHFPGISLVPMENNQVSVLKEDLVYEIKADQEEGNYPEKLVAEVKASYLLKNTGEQEEKLLLAFPFNGSWEDSRYNIKILFDNVEVEHQLMVSKSQAFDYQNSYYLDDVETLYNPAFEEVIRDLREEIAADLEPEDDRGVRVILFELDFLPQVEHVLEVQYKELPTMARESLGLLGYFIHTPWFPVFHYYLEPAKHWESFQNLSITISTPENFPIDYISLPEISQGEEGMYEGYFRVLPEKNLIFTLHNLEKEAEMERGLKIFRWVITGIVVAVIVIFILLVVVAVYFIRKWRK